jgi:hypothetical protein
MVEAEMPKKRKSRGRGDLWLISPESEHEIIEAKFGIRYTAKPKSTGDGLLRAVEDAKKHDKKEWEQRLGIYIMCPKIEKPKASEPKASEMVVQKIIEFIDKGNAVPCDWFLWSFPILTRNFIGTQANFLFPGVCCFGKAA